MLALVILALISRAAGTDSVKVWVLLKDKGLGAAARGAQAKVSAFPNSAPAARALENLPLHEPYVEALRSRGFVPDVRLKWQNRISGSIDADRMDALRGLPFVAGVSLLPRKAPRSRGFPEGRRIRSGGMPGLGKRAADVFDYGEGRGLVDSLQGGQSSCLDGGFGHVARGGACAWP